MSFVALPMDEGSLDCSPAPDCRALAASGWLQEMDALPQPGVFRRFQGISWKSRGPSAGCSSPTALGVPSVGGK